MRLTARKNDYAANLSHGQKQWLEIGMLLAQEPKLLLVDETRGRHDRCRDERDALLLKDIAKTRSVVVVEHDMGFIRDLGVKVTCLAEGSVLAEGSIDFVSNDPKVIEKLSGPVRGGHVSILCFRRRRQSIEPPFGDAFRPIRTIRQKGTHPC